MSMKESRILWFRKMLTLTIIISIGCLVFLATLYAQNENEYEENTTLHEVKSLLEDIEGLTFRQVGRKIVIEGEIYTHIDIQKFNKVIAIYPSEEVVNLVVDRTKKYQVGVSIIIVNVSNIAFSEYNPQANLMGTIEKGFEGVTTSLVFNSNILSAVSYWVTKGNAEVVYNERITTVDGETGKILIGGEFPFTEIGPDGYALTTWKEFGVKLEVQPKIQGSGDILVKIYTEASEISPIFGQPALASRTAESTIAVENGGTSILGGLQKTASGSSVSKVPILGDILPFLFRKEHKIKENSELLFLVTATTPPNFSVNDYFLIQESQMLDKPNAKQK